MSHKRYTNNINNFFHEILAIFFYLFSLLGKIKISPPLHSNQPAGPSNFFPESGEDLGVVKLVT